MELACGKTSSITYCISAGNPLIHKTENSRGKSGDLIAVTKQVCSSGLDDWCIKRVVNSFFSSFVINCILNYENAHGNESTPILARCIVCDLNCNSDMGRAFLVAFLVKGMVDTFVCDIFFTQKLLEGVDQNLSHFLCLVNVLTLYRSERIS